MYVYSSVQITAGTDFKPIEATMFSFITEKHQVGP